MGSAIAISVNNDTGEHIKRLWRKMNEFEQEPSMEALCYPPHFTFAIYEDANIDHLGEAVSDVFGDVGMIHLEFDQIGHFDASPLVLWASPRNAEILADLHAAIHGRIDPTTCHEHYRTEMWVPHCTLATEIATSSREAALIFAEKDIAPFDVVFDAVDYISLPPVAIACRRSLIKP